MKAIVKFAIEKASEGVPYSPQYGAICPLCGAIKMPAYKTMPWDDKTCVRYHKCRNVECKLCEIGMSIKSVQVDRSGVDIRGVIEKQQEQLTAESTA